MQQAEKRPLGFWACWSLTVGTMIGSGVFALPAVLAPYGLMSFGGWLLTGASSILLALVIARLATRTTRSGGPYVFARDAFGDVVGFLVGWGYWASFWIAIPVVAIAFVGYLPVLFPPLAANVPAQIAIALALIWTLTLIAVRGVRAASVVQIVTTFLKLIPLLVVIALGLATGAPEHLPAYNPRDAQLLPVLATTALITMWAFSSLEAGCLPAGAVKDPQRTIPRAVIAGMLTVTAVYLASTAAVMLLVPAEELATSTAPFADAARGLGAWGPTFVAIGALIATAGTLNGVIFVAGQLPMAAALDRLAPAVFARCTAGGSPHVALLLSSALGSVLLLANYTRGMMGAFTFLLMMSTMAYLVPLLVCAAAELRHSWRSARGWAGVALLAALYCAFAILGSGAETIGWGVLLLLAGVPVYFFGRAKAAAAAQ